MSEVLQTKICTRCKQLQSLRRFGWLKKHHRGRPEIHRDSWCFDCRKDYKRSPRQKAKTAARIRERRLTDPEFRKTENDKQKAYYKKNRDKVLAACRRYITKKGRGNLNLGYLDARLRGKFGISLEQYYEMSEAQGHSCAVCGCPDRTRTRRLAVDHDHATGKVRALLCHHCNTGMGNFFDNPALLWKAIEYLTKHSNIRDVS